ncbi:MAG: hypothetical protein GYA24_03650 [Candidatus Lokiarchaeota archaeon]|nr:hypothetical protein [Candidatus Lokiarchaeota archaeon]
MKQIAKTSFKFFQLVDHGFDVDGMMLARLHFSQKIPGQLVIPHHDALWRRGSSWLEEHGEGL